MHLTKLVVTMKAANAGCNQVVNKRYQFVDGKFAVINSPDACQSLARYMDAMFNCDIWMGPADADPPAPVVEVVEPEVEAPVGEPNERLSMILDAVQAVDIEDWIQDVTPHPPVATVAELMDDASVTKEEIIEVCENWLPEDEDAAAKEE